MDEVDGRPGPVALKPGHLNASHGVLPFSLSLQTKPVILSERSESKDPRLFFIPRATTHIVYHPGETHENVPGK
jgi:hypothetical protein